MSTSNNFLRASGVSKLRPKIYLVEIDFTSDQLILEKIKTGDGWFVNKKNEMASRRGFEPLLPG